MDRAEERPRQRRLKRRAREDRLLLAQTRSEINEGMAQSVWDGDGRLAVFQRERQRERGAARTENGGRGRRGVRGSDRTRFAGVRAGRVPRRTDDLFEGLRPGKRRRKCAHYV